MKTSEIKETEETERDVPRITVRHKDETKEEKKQRKQEVKSERKVTLFFSYKNIFYKNIEAEICEILRIL